MKLKATLFLCLVFLTGCTLHPADRLCVVKTPPPPAIVAPTPAPAVVETPAPAPAPEVAAAVVPPVDLIDEGIFNLKVQDIFFGLNSANIPVDQGTTLAADAAFLNEHPTVQIKLVSSCDVRGTDTYNISLGQRRVNAVVVGLLAQGISRDRILTAGTVGKTNYFCSKPTKSEACYSLNRRVHFVFAGTK
jgi:peptidoglycan-associated lipoprotein